MEHWSEDPPWPSFGKANFRLSLGWSRWIEPHWADRALNTCRDSKIETYQKMWRYMESNDPDTFVHSYEEGVERVLRGNYAFLCESTMLDYLLQRNCNLTQIGGLLDNKGYGIATPIGSKWKDKISQAVLFLQVSSPKNRMARQWKKTHNSNRWRFSRRKKVWYKCTTINGGRTMDPKLVASAKRRNWTIKRKPMHWAWSTLGAFLSCFSAV